MKKADIGMIGLAVMGENLVMNMESKGFTVAGYDIDQERVKTFASGRAKDKNIVFASSLADFVKLIAKPRKIMMMIKAGKPVDDVIDKLMQLLDAQDIIIDGGNSNYQDTIRRCAFVESKGMLYIGTGVSGGEEGALLGPSIMPGGSQAAWEHVKPIFQAIAARAEDGSICCDWVGSDGAGHFVKMVHNGIEYGDIQLIGEAYHLLKTILKLDADDLQSIFASWNKTELDSYLIEITGNILGYKDEDGKPLVDKILDTAGQKGTGKWTAIESLEEGVPLTLIGEAVYARCLSAMKEERVEASKTFSSTRIEFDKDATTFIEEVRKALYAAKIISYAQGFTLMRAAAETHGWKLNYGNIAMMWRGGCIIRSQFLGKIKTAYDNLPELSNLLLDPYFKSIIESNISSWREVVIAAIKNGIPTPALASGIAYFDGYTSETLPANLLQAQRDYFGAHTYERIDKPRGEFFHTNWTGRGGKTSSTTYNV
ncbi:MAG: decarboxylating NADP(+)-dependent phosphogluconate dehydrogenase [Bacilli bacterium]|nr:decarboxylating NADP(+)-dependent phosphogluconate dehydrogenase [Bacilli bacterium]